MKNSRYFFKQKNPFLIFLLALSLCFVSNGPVLGSVEGVRQWKDSFLDGIENFVISTGIVDVKRKAMKDLGLLVKPFFKTRYTLTSNVFHAPDTDSDLTDNSFSFTPGLQVIYKTPLGVIGAAYEATFDYFLQFEKQNMQKQSFLIYANLFPSEQTYFRVSERLDDNESVAGSSAFKPIEYLDNVVNVVGGYVWGDWTFELGFENANRNFRNVVADRFDMNETKFDYRIYKVIADNLRAYSGVRVGLVDFPRISTRDTVYFEIPLGIEGTLPGGVLANMSVGVHRRNLGDVDRNDVTQVVTNISLRKRFNQERTQVELGFLRRPVESTFATATIYDEKLWYGNVKHLVTPKLRARLSAYLGNRDFEERVFTGTRVVVGGRVFVLSPNVVKRDDDIFGMDLGFDYHVRKWLIFHIDYQYSRRNSNISALDYTENVFSLGSTMPF